MLKLRSTRKIEARVPLTPLIDMVFLLLVFFLLTTRFITEEGISVKLPQASSTTPQPQREITVYVSKEGRIFIGKKEYTLVELYDKLKELIGSDKGKLVVVKADKEVILDKAVKVMDMAKTAGAAKLCIATEKESK